MRKLVVAFAMLFFLPLACRLCPVHAAADVPPQPEKVVPVPSDYREWVYMSSGLDMTYAAATSPHKGPSIFDNVFVNPDSWRTFKQTGTWPDGTTFVLENRIAEQNFSINRGGNTQGSAVDGLELHQKRNGEWLFYVRAASGQEQLVPKPASCYTCHEAHAAVDTTFAEFYPTAMPIAQSKNKISQAYLAEQTSAPQK